MSENQENVELSEMKDEKSPDLTQVKFDYIKGNFFRVIHVDGAWGGITPNLNIQMAIFNERGAIPEQSVYEVKEGKIGGEIVSERKARGAIVREIEASLVMDLRAAKALRGWLDDRIKQLDELSEAHSSEKVD